MKFMSGQAMKNQSACFDAIVIGGGAAGMFAAITAAGGGARVALLEPNGRLGKKLAITGKGRCNVTNHCTPEEVLQNIPRNSRFLMSALHRFTPADTMAFFEQHGCPLKTERGQRVFPVSDCAFSVIDALRAELRRLHVRVLQTAAQEILTADGAAQGVRTAQGILSAPHIVLCTGGCSYPATGSTGDGYRMAAQLGHMIIPPRPSLVPLEEDGTLCAQMQGLSLRNVTATLRDARGKVCFSEFGELLFTHFGLSGPVILSASSRVAPDARYTVELDLKPALDEEKLDARLLREISLRRNQNFSSLLGALLPSKMLPVMAACCAIDPAQKVNALTRAQRHTLLEKLKCFPIAIRGPRPIEEAIITAGGVKTSEVNPKTMASKLVRGVYFAGEVLDCDAYTGGFNLQIAWSTAYAAGLTIRQEIDDEKELFDCN